MWCEKMQDEGQNSEKWSKQIIAEHFTWGPEFTLFLSMVMWKIVETMHSTYYLDMIVVGEYRVQYLKAILHSESG